MWLIILIISRLFQSTELLGLHLYQHHCMWFLLGYLYFNKLENLLIHNVNKNWILLCRYVTIVFFLILATKWNRTGTPIFLDNIINKFDIIPIVAKGIIYLYKLCVPIFGIITTLLFGFELFNNTNLKNQILFLGKNTLEIYALHFYFIMRMDLFNTRISNIVGKSIIAIAMSLIVAMIIQQSKIAKLLLFGKYIK